MLPHYFAGEIFTLLCGRISGHFEKSEDSLLNIHVGSYLHKVPPEITLADFAHAYSSRRKNLGPIVMLSAYLYHAAREPPECAG